MTSSLVGSEMCIRDRRIGKPSAQCLHRNWKLPNRWLHRATRWPRNGAVSYTHLTLPTICSV
eukprot:3289232-Prorocentrum_lima.AAC.1